MYKDVTEQIDACKTALLDLAEKSQEYVDLHDEFLWDTVTDATLLKDKMKEKVVRVINENQ